MSRKHAAPGFRSWAQEEWMWRNKPDIARNWTVRFGTFKNPHSGTQSRGRWGCVLSWREVEAENG